MICRAGSTAKPAATCGSAPRAGPGLSRTSPTGCRATLPSLLPTSAARNMARISSKRWKRGASTGATSMSSIKAISPTYPMAALLKFQAMWTKRGSTCPSSATCRLPARPPVRPVCVCSRWEWKRPCGGDVTLLKQAMLHDPLVGAVCNPEEVWQMTDELLVAQAQWAAAVCRTDQGCRPSLGRRRKRRHTGRNSSDRRRGPPAHGNGEGDDDESRRVAGQCSGGGQRQHDADGGGVRTGAGSAGFRRAWLLYLITTVVLAET